MVQSNEEEIAESDEVTKCVYDVDVKKSIIQYIELSY